MFKQISPIKHPKCHPILPLVYDDSLSYYEALCKLTGKMNETISAINDNFVQLVRERLAELFIESMYEAETETLVLKLKYEGDNNG